MVFPIKPLCAERFVRRDGTAFIYIQYCFSAKQRTLLNTKIAIPPQFWDQKKGCISQNLPGEFGNSEEQNGELKRMLRTVEDIIRYATKNKIRDIGQFVKKTFTPRFEISITQKVNLAKNGGSFRLDIYDQIDDYIRSKERKVCEDMPRIYRNMRDHLKSFEEFRGIPITFDTLDLNFYEEFVDFLTYDYVQKSRSKKTGLKINTIGKTIKQLRTFLRNRMRKRIIPPVDMDGWTILEEEVDAIYLWPKIKNIVKG